VLCSLSCMPARACINTSCSARQAPHLPTHANRLTAPPATRSASIIQLTERPHLRPARRGAPSGRPPAPRRRRRRRRAPPQARRRRARRDASGPPRAARRRQGGAPQTRRGARRRRRRPARAAARPAAPRAPCASCPRSARGSARLSPALVPLRSSSRSWASGRLRHMHNPRATLNAGARRSLKQPQG